MLVIKSTGHENILANHKTTWQLTNESHLTLKGDCIVGVNSTHSAYDLPDTMKIWLKNGNWVSIKIIIGDHEFQGKGQGHTNLTFEDKIDMVFRKSQFTCPRTITINTSFSAFEIPNNITNLLKSRDTSYKIQLNKIINE